MPTLNVDFRLCREGAVAPSLGSAGAAAFDLHCVEEVVFTSQRPTVVVNTGVEIELAYGVVGLVCSRSGLAANQNIFVLNAPGVIDSDYRGEIKVILHKLGMKDHVGSNFTVYEQEILPAGSRVAQLLILNTLELIFKARATLSETARGANGLGSTGL